MPQTDTPYSMVPPLFGLVLAGGWSSRLGRDKGAIEYHGRSQASWALQLLTRLCPRVYVSVREAQRQDPTYADFLTVTDAPGFGGPAAGLLAACRAEPGVAWLVLAVDLPLMDDAALAGLVAARDHRLSATAYRHADGTPEPLCAIWEPVVRERLGRTPSAGGISLRRLLESDAKLIRMRNPEVLESVNTPDQEAAVRRRLAGRETRVGFQPRE